ncbi:hypothetical protein [Flavobacterium gyeonganense]|uniref:Lipoprotein n=1 Tax=Flavobacterium gyeonganense TaxID=1310418 RepID=A0ABV5HD79_9FLAO|nr:hypothetical protein [Flavobacterium gyeonganense]
MKKILTLFAVVGLFAFSGCSDDDNDIDNDTISEVIEVKGYNFNSGNGYRIRYDLNPEIFPGDMVLVYRLVAVEDGVKVWNPLREIAFDNNGAYDFSYNFEFSRFDVDIFMLGDDLGSVNTNLRLNQTFRIVIIPGAGNNLTSKKSVDFSDYNSVIKAYNIDDSNVKIVK